VYIRKLRRHRAMKTDLPPALWAAATVHVLPVCAISGKREMLGVTATENNVELQKVNIPPRQYTPSEAVASHQESGSDICYRHFMGDEKKGEDDV
jgi:hypothetical protein